MGPVNQESDIDFKLSVESTDADLGHIYDEVSGKPLKTSLVEAARAEELDFAKKAPWFLGLGANSGVLGSNRSSSNRFKMD